VELTRDIIEKISTRNLKRLKLNEKIRCSSRRSKRSRR